MKTYVIRKQLRTPVQGIFSYPVNGTWTTGKAWDISQTGFRTTEECPLLIGLETMVFLTLNNGDELHHILIESAIVRWSNGPHAGWEILRMDAVNQVIMADVIKQCDAGKVTSDAMLMPA
jgi:hypothetical protein